MPPARPPAAAHVIVRRTTMTWANPGDRPSQPPLYPPLPPAYPASSGYPGQAGYARVEPAATPNAPQAGEQNVVRPAAVSAPPETASTPAGAGRTPRPGFDSDGRVRTRPRQLAAAQPREGPKIRPSPARPVHRRSGAVAGGPRSTSPQPTSNAAGPSAQVRCRARGGSCRARLHRSSRRARLGSARDTRRGGLQLPAAAMPPDYPPDLHDR